MKSFFDHTFGDPPKTIEQFSDFDCQLFSDRYEAYASIFNTDRSV